MKKFLLIFLTFLASFFRARATDTIMPDPPKDKYHVIKLQGTITYKNNQKALKRENTFVTLDELVFLENAAMYVFDEDGKVFKLIQNTASQKYQLERTNLKASNRPGKILEYIAFQQFLADKKLLILGDSFAIEVGEEAFSLDENRFFYVEYEWNGDNIPKQLRYQGQHILIEKDSLFQVDGQKIEASTAQNFALYYYNQSTEESLFINHFQPVFPDEQTVEKELRLIKRVLNNENWTAEERYRVMENYLVAVYGVPTEGHLRGWLTLKGLMGNK